MEGKTYLSDPLISRQLIIRTLPDLLYHLHPANYDYPLIKKRNFECGVMILDPMSFAGTQMDTPRTFLYPSSSSILELRVKWSAVRIENPGRDDPQSIGIECSCGGGKLQN